MVHSSPVVGGGKGGLEEGGHVISEGPNDKVREFLNKVTVDKVVHSDIESDTVEHAAGTHSIGNGLCGGQFCLQHLCRRRHRGRQHHSRPWIGSWPLAIFCR